MIIFSSFGSNGYYVELAEKTFIEFKKSYPNAQKKIFTVNDIPSKYIQFSQKEPRGYGYWWWLAFIYKELISESKENDVIIWSDARSGFKESKAEKALRAGHSLWPGGATKCTGKFSRGGVVAVKREDGQIIAKGLASFNQVDTGKILGIKSEDIPSVLGYNRKPELIHRDNMAFFN